MQRHESSPRVRPSRWPRLVYAWVTALLVFALLEILAGGCLWIMTGRPVGLSTLRTQRAAVARVHGESESTAAGESGNEETEQWVLRLDQREVLHPYVGFVEDPQGAHLRNLERFDPEAIMYGFPRNHHRLFYQPSPNLAVVVVVGGSVSRQVSFGAQERLERTLGEIARFRGREVRALSLGLGGYKQPQQVMVVNYFLSLGVHMDVLINIDGFNEVTLPVTDNLTGGINPFYPRAWGYRVGSIDPDERRARGKIKFLRDLRRETALAFERAPLRWTLTCGLVWRLTDRSLVNRIAAAEQHMLDRGSQDRSYQALGPGYEPASPEALWRDLAAVWARSSLQLHQLATSRGIEYYHFLQPNQYDEGSKPLTLLELREAFNADSPYRDAARTGYPALRAASAELRRGGVTYTDLSGIFATTTDDVYIDTCCHMNDKGVGMLVDRIASVIAAHQLSPPENR